MRGCSVQSREAARRLGERSSVRVVEVVSWLGVESALGYGGRRLRSINHPSSTLEVIRRAFGTEDETIFFISYNVDMLRFCKAHWRLNIDVWNRRAAHHRAQTSLGRAGRSRRPHHAT